MILLKGQTATMKIKLLRCFIIEYLTTRTTIIIIIIIIVKTILIGAFIFIFGNQFKAPQG